MYSKYSKKGTTYLTPQSSQSHGKLGQKDWSYSLAKPGLLQKLAWLRLIWIVKLILYVNLTHAWRIAGTIISLRWGLSNGAHWIRASPGSGPGSSPTSHRTTWPFSPGTYNFHHKSKVSIKYNFGTYHNKWGYWDKSQFQKLHLKLSTWSLDKSLFWYGFRIRRSLNRRTILPKHLKCNIYVIVPEY